jgi:hypothetical protein
LGFLLAMVRCFPTEFGARVRGVRTLPMLLL